MLIKLLTYCVLSIVLLLTTRQFGRRVDCIAVFTWYLLIWAQWNELISVYGRGKGVALSVEPN
jgi:hypothetical protein